MLFQKWIDKRAWSAGLVKAILDYSLSIWKFRCALLHGRSKEEAHQKLLLSLRWQVLDAYQKYSEDPLIIAHNLRHIFYIPLDQRLLQDVNSLQCFLSTYAVAIKQQEYISNQNARVAEKFFFPRSLPTEICRPYTDGDPLQSDMSAITMDSDPTDSITYLSNSSLSSTHSMTSGSQSSSLLESGGSNSPA